MSRHIERDERHKNRHQVVWVPLRCEVDGCDVHTGLSRCGTCALVFYCGAEHQRADWRRHRVECAHLASLRLVSLPYEPAVEVRDHPLGERPSELSDKCGLCGETRRELLELTECCGETVCNREDEYVLMSFSRDFCSRSHGRYTRCGFHTNEGHEGDWRTCDQCDAERTPGVVCWYETNGYNFTPGVRRERGALYTQACTSCGKRIHTGMEEFSFGARGVQCGPCLMSSM